MAISFAAAIKAAKNGFELVTSAVGSVEKLRDAFDIGRPVDTEIVAGLLQVQQHLFQAQQAHAATIRAMEELHRKVMEMERFDEKSQRYQLRTTPAGAVVLALKQLEGDEEPPHSICPDCHAQGVFRILQPKGAGVDCGGCNRFFRIDPDTADPAGTGSVRTSGRFPSGGTW